MHTADHHRVRTAGPRVSTLLAGTGGAAALVLVLLVTVAIRPLDPADRHLYKWVHGSPGTAETTLAKHLTVIGDGVPLITVLLALCVVVRLVWKRWEPLAVTSLAITFGGAASTVLKLGAGRDRPPVAGWMSEASGNSFPSGHTTVATAGYVALALAVAVLVNSPLVRALVVGTGAGLALAIGWTRVELGVHWPTDVLAGWALGTAAACAALACWVLAPPTLRP